MTKNNNFVNLLLKGVISFKNNGGVNTNNIGNLEISIGEIEKDFVEKLYKTVEQKLREELERVGIEVKDKIFRFEKKRLDLKTFQILVTVPEPDQTIEKGIISATGTAIFKCEYNGKLTTLEIAIETIIGSDKSQILNLGEFLSLFAAPLKCGICQREIESKYIQQKFARRWKIVPRSNENKMLSVKFSSPLNEEKIETTVTEIFDSIEKKILKTVSDLKWYDEMLSQLNKKVSGLYELLRSRLREKCLIEWDEKLCICPECQNSLKEVKILSDLTNFSLFQDLKEIELFEYLGKTTLTIEFKEA